MSKSLQLEITRKPIILGKDCLFLGSKYLIFLLLSFFTLNAKADYYSQHERGWHWYDDPTPVTVSPDKSAPSTMATVKQAIQNALDTAIINPTPQNVERYIGLQNQASNQASRFAQVWQAVLLQNPKLNYSIEHPTNQLGRQVFTDQQRRAEDAAIVQFAQHSGLFFFYRSTCPYCQRFAPIVKSFTDKYHIAVVPITTDGIALPPFLNSQIDQGQAAKFHVEVEPALFTVDPYTHQAVPVSYGLTTEDELRTRILEIATQGKSV